MPTYGRPVYVNEAVKMFLEQDYPADHCELIVMNDCPGQVFRADPEIEATVRVFNRPNRYATLGEKRNACIELAKGDLIAIWDDDDLYLPWRLGFSHEQMRIHNTAFYRASTYWTYWGGDRLHENQATREWISHSLCLFEKELWRRAGGYPEMDTGEDTQFYFRVREVMGGNPDDWITYPIERADRYYILRGLSRYRHMSIAGGTGELDTTEGDYCVRPKAIGDPNLADVFARLIAGRGCFTNQCIELNATPSQQSPEPSVVEPTPETIRVKTICGECPQQYEVTGAALGCVLAGNQPVPWNRARCKLRKW